MSALLTGGAVAKPLALQVATAHVASGAGDQPMVDVRVTPESATLLRAVSRQQLGKTIEVRLGGQLVMSPMLTHEIVDGRFRITGAFSKSEAQLMIKRLNEAGAVVEVEARVASK